MQFWLCASLDGRHDFTNYCPYKNKKGGIDGFWFWYPTWLGGCSLSLPVWKMDNVSHQAIESMGGPIPNGSCKNLVTGQIVPYEDLLTMDDYDQKKYYPWGVN